MSEIVNESTEQEGSKEYLEDRAALESYKVVCCPHCGKNTEIAPFVTGHCQGNHKYDCIYCYNEFDVVAETRYVAVKQQKI